MICKDPPLTNFLDAAARWFISAAICSAILLTGVHGAAGLEASGLLRTDKWQTDADELVDMLLAMVSGHG